MKLIELRGKYGKGLFAKIDDKNFNKVSCFKWYGIKDNRCIYAVYHNKSGSKPIFMHRLILGITDPKIKIDHYDNDGLNNQESNLRIATSAQNTHNKRKNINSLSSYKGVCRVIVKGKNKVNVYWKTCIRVNNKSIQKYSKTEIEAAIKYDELALEHFGKFANINFPKNKTK
jgi:hypothetical protein